MRLPTERDDAATLRAHLALPAGYAEPRTEALGAVLDARARTRRARAAAEAAREAADAEEHLLALAEAALTAWDAAHPLPAPPVDGAQPPADAQARLAAFMARQTTTPKETDR